MRFCVLASGSKGNVVYFESGATRILIDAGVSTKQLKLRLAEIGVKPSQLNGICITHEHDDHVRGLPKFSKDFGIPVYVTHQTFANIKQNEKIMPVVRYIDGGAPFRIEDLQIHPFPISHDAADPHGFIVQNETRRVAVATDMGYVTTLVRHRLQNMDWMVLEANYDEHLLKAGPYPWMIKQRVMGKHGHLSNLDSATAIREVHHDGLLGVSLAHLSEVNNRPELALETVQDRLEQWRLNHVKVTMTHQHKVCDMIEL